MAQYYNFKNIVDDVKLLVEKHLQIRSFGVGDIKDLIALTQEIEGEDNTEKNEAPLYPLLYMVPQPVQRDESFITYNFSVLIMDIDNVKNKHIQVDLLSDTLEMCEDILAQFKYSVNQQQGNYYDKYDVNVPAPITPFMEQYEDKLIGWTLQLQVVVDKPLNRCIAPFNTFEA
jgi:hypothetical protein